MRYFFTGASVIVGLVSLAAAAPEFSRRGATICGRKGWDTGIDSYYNGKEGSYSACSALCVKASKCKSFSWYSKECDLYTVPVTGNFEEDKDSYYTFYDVACVSSSSATTSSSSTTKVSTTVPVTTNKSTTKSIPSTTSSKISTTSSTSGKASTTASTKAQTTLSTKLTTAVTSVKSSSSTTSSKTTSSKSSTTSGPPCALPTFVVTNFKFFNSTHNLDCAGKGPDVGDGTGCIKTDAATGQTIWCDPLHDRQCTNCNIPVCSTGLPTQPLGYGPADTVSADITNIGSCLQSNPGTTPLRSIGDNVVRCAGSQIQWVFNGNSNSASSIARFDLQNSVSCPDGSSYRAYGSADVRLSCSYDLGRNATCVIAAGSASIPATTWSS